MQIGTDIGSEVIFTITGMVLVFLILILLMVIIQLEGKIFDSVSGKNKESIEPAPKAQPAVKQAAAQVQKAAAPVPVPSVEQGIPAEVVAAIMAAIYTMGNGKYKLKAVRRGANNWGKAGVSDSTAPF